MATININQFLFTRTQPQKKLEVINGLTSEQIMQTSKDTLIRIVRETGRNFYKSRNKELHISRDRMKGNNWNAWIEGLELIKGRLYIDCYVQYSSTDTNTSESYDEFFSRGEFRGEIHGTDRYDNPKTWYYLFDSTDKVGVMKSFLLEYVYTKYHDKLEDKDGNNK